MSFHLTGALSALLATACLVGVSPLAQAATGPIPGHRIVVRPGDTLSGLSAEFRVPVRLLERVNHISNPRLLRAGAKLWVPGTRVSHKPYRPHKMVRDVRTTPVVTLGQRIVNTARRYVGVPYVWGGESPQYGFDCSGLVQYVFSRVGVHISRTSYEQYHDVKRVSWSQLKPGDLLFFSTDGPGASHVAIYAGWDRATGYQVMIDAPMPGQRVRVQNLDTAFWHQHFYGAGVVTR